MGFDTFNAMIEGSYAMRYWYNMDGKKYFEHMTNPAHGEYIASRTFDHYHAMAGSELAAQIVPTVKMIMLDFFNERGWIVGEELNEAVFGHKSTIYTQVNDFLTKNYPELSDSKRREVAYAAIHQTYAHFQPQQILSRTRGTVGFRGKLYGDDHAHFAPFRRFYSYGYEGAGAPSKHEGWGKGSMALPAWQDLRSKVWKVQDKPQESEFENITWTSPYGGLIEYGSRQFGHFLTYTDKEHFDGTIPKTMLPYNILDGGSDDKLRGWRQNNKVIGNLSTSLYERKSASDDIQLSSTYTQPDHITNIWKSVENVGINYVRSMMETLGQMTVDPATGAIKDEAKIEHLYRFLYRRYFRSDQTENPQLAKFREHMLASFPALQGQTIGSDDEFWLAVKTQVTQSKSAAIHEPLLNRVYTIMLAERNPMTFMTISTSWTTQTGETLWNKVKAECKEVGSGFVESGEEFGGKWDEVRNDLILIQSEARGKVTKDIRANRKTWQKRAGPDKNIFGDFTQDRSEVSVDGKGKGYVVTDDTIEKVLREKFGQSQGVEARIAR
jgi:hypothetical protein